MEIYSKWIHYGSLPSCLSDTLCYRDRATYDPDLDAYVLYPPQVNFSVPSNLTFGKPFFDLAASNPGPVTLGLNRLFNNISNTLEAAQEAVKRIPQLDAIEFGNEPNGTHYF